MGQSKIDFEKEQEAGFANFEYWQTLFHTDEKTIQHPQPGYGKGGFVVIKGIKVYV